jgi:hypothetical protein
LLIANVTDGQTADVNVFADPMVGAHVSPTPSSAWTRREVPLTAAEAQSHVIVTSSMPVIVQLVAYAGERLNTTGVLSG